MVDLLFLFYFYLLNKQYWQFHGYHAVAVSQRDLPVPALLCRFRRLGIDQCANTCSLEVFFECGAVFKQCRILRLVAQHWHDDDLARRDHRWQPQTVVVTVGHDDPTDEPR